MKKRIVIGADHRGFDLKNFLTDQDHVESYSVFWDDVGTFTPERTDYPIYAKKIVDKMYELKNINPEEEIYGIALCGTGIGMSIAMNRFPDIYAGLVWDANLAKIAKEDDNCNVFVIPADFVTEQEAYVMIATWLTSKFKKGRYADRIEMIDKLRPLCD